MCARCLAVTNEPILSESNMYTLYYFPYSNHSRRVLALLEEAKLPYTLETVDMMTGQHVSPAYAAVNPNCQVPALVAGDFKMFESNAMLRYLCNKHQLDSWYPQNAEARAIVDQWLDWTQSRFAPATSDIVLNKVFLGPKGDPEAVVRGEKKLAALTPILEQALEGRRFLTGDTPTIADLALASNITQLSFADATPRLPNIQGWYARVCEIPGFKKSLPAR